ncbi:MAG TPA: HNH endonuclease [Candidatus Paceibacterota bacterium]|nr:HNH endonuclease [Candidatus Paceibacterota bacterium]
MSVLNNPVLILNKNWIAIKVRNVKVAIRITSRERAYIVDTNTYEAYTWEQWINILPKQGEKFIQTVSKEIKLPEVILLTQYGKVPEGDVRLTKKNIFIRDSYRCQYTGEILDRGDADIDHIVPRSKGGTNEWSNLVVSSKKINRKKGNRTPEEAGLKLLKQPKKPNYKSIMFDPRKKIPKCWEKFI